MSVDPATAKHKAEHAGATYYFCSPAAARSSSPIPARLSCSRQPGRPAPKPAPRGRDLHLPDASANPAGRSGQLPDLRHGSRAGNGHGRATGPSAELVDMTRRFWIGLALAVPVFALEMGGHLAICICGFRPKLSNWIQLVLATPVVLWAGWPFFERAWALARQPQSQHVHADRHGHRRRLGLQRRRDRRARPLPAGVPRHGRRGRGLFRGGGGRSPSSCCSARCSSCARANRPAARSGRCSTLRQRPRGASAPTAQTRKSASRRSRSAIGCACGPARRSRSTARSSKAAARSTNPW